MADTYTLDTSDLKYPVDGDTNLPWTKSTSAKWYTQVKLNNPITIKNPENEAQTFSLNYLPAGLTVKFNPKIDGEYAYKRYQGYTESSKTGADPTQSGYPYAYFGDKTYNPDWKNTTKFKLRFAGYYNSSNEYPFLFLASNQIRIPYYTNKWGSHYYYKVGMVLFYSGKYYKVKENCYGPNLSCLEQIAAPTGEDLTSIYWGGSGTNDYSAVIPSSVVVYPKDPDKKALYQNAYTYYTINNTTKGIPDYLSRDGDTLAGTEWKNITTGSRWAKATIKTSSGSDAGESAINWYVSKATAEKILSDGSASFTVPNSFFSHTVNFLDADGNIIKAVTKTPNSTLKTPKETEYGLYRDGYNLNKWVYSDGKGLNIELEPNALYTYNFPSSEARIITLSPVYNAATFKITFCSNPDGTTSIEKTINYGETEIVEKLDGVEEPLGYSFAGWEAPDGTRYALGEDLSRIGEDIVLKPYYAPKVYNLHFRRDETSIIKLLTSVTYEPNKQITFPDGIIEEDKVPTKWIGLDKEFDLGRTYNFSEIVTNNNSTDLIFTLSFTDKETINQGTFGGIYLWSNTYQKWLSPSDYVCSVQDGKDIWILK